jgi:hypothetical protein
MSNGVFIGEFSQHGEIKKEGAKGRNMFFWKKWA